MYEVISSMHRVPSEHNQLMDLHNFLYFVALKNVFFNFFFLRFYLLSLPVLLSVFLHKLVR